ncbi:hypothetical protein DOTSEDRAFT_97187, partial [Dothistroma septosporum NZE10]
LPSSPPVTASIPSENLTISGGIAIFHLATARVVLCYHTRDRYFFLPKGRKNVHENILSAAEREGFEESGFRNRVLALSIEHGQTLPETGEGHGEDARFVTEPLWTQMLPLRAGSTRQYLLFWYAGETVPQDAEAQYQQQAENASQSSGKQIYRPPPPFPQDMTIRQRIGLDARLEEDGKKAVYEPVKHEGTGVDEEEMLYTAALVPINEAMRKLRGRLEADVVNRAWEGIQLRMRLE